MVFKLARERKLANKDKNQKIKSPKAPRSESVKILPLSEELLKGLAKHAKVAAESRFNSSKNYEFACKRLELFPKFDLEELQLGETLGKGRFGVVTEIKQINLKNVTPPQQTSPLCKTEESEDRLFIQRCCVRKSSAGAERGDSCRYAIKLLDERNFTTKEDFVSGARDMAIEAHFLAAIEHPHILKLRGLSQEALGNKKFFVVFDRLYGTLKDRLIGWRLQQHITTRGLNRIIETKAIKEKKLELLATRLRVMRELSSAVLYLHNNNIIDRDLKPDNIGFDIRGDVKLFDFGLSTEFDPSKSKPYKLTGMTGSLVYMAPEVQKCHLYDESCDIYSLGLIFWRVLSLKPLFPYMSPKILIDLVVKQGARPDLNPKWSKPLRTLIRDMWDPNPLERPTIKKVNLLLKRELALVKAKALDADLDDEDSSSCNEKILLSRKSTYPQRRFTSV